jgi:heme/copper-type cytochrome/quinol oxidase subunit 4
VLLALLAFSPALFMARLIARYGVDIPYADEWAWVDFLSRAHEHTLKFAEFSTQHNEHRYFLPKLILLVLTPLTSGNTKGAMFFSLLLVALTSASFWSVLRRTVNTSVHRTLLLLGLLNLLLFSPVQAENWTWGYQYVLFLTNALLAAGVAAAVSRLALHWKFVVCVAIAFGATFSFGGGAILWAIIFPVALLYETRLHPFRRWFWLAGWILAGVVAMACYFNNYVKPSYHPPLAASRNPLDYFLYITTFLGGHLSKADRNESIVIAASFGTLLLALYLGGFLWMMRSRDPDSRRNMLPWLGIGAFAFANAALAATTRIGFGLNQGQDSRYATFSLYLSISIVGLFAVAITNRSQQKPKHREINGIRWFGTAWLLTACPTLLLIGYLYAFWWGIGAIQESWRNRLHGKAALLFTNVLDAGPTFSKYLIADAGQVTVWANVADRLGLMHPRLFESPDLSKMSSRAQLAGFFEKVTAKNADTWEASGWAMIPKGVRPADAIVLAYEDPGKGRIAFAVTTPTIARPHVSEALQDRRYEACGWSCEFKRSKVPEGPQVITAWAFDAEKTVLYPLTTRQTLP